MNTQVPNQPSLMLDPDPGLPASVGIGVYRLDAAAMACLGRYMQTGGPLQSILRVTVVPAGPPAGDDLPDVFGSYQVLQDGVRFIPHFPFERGLSYRAIFDPRPLGRSELPDRLALEFSLPREQRAVAAGVKHVFPSSASLPENLLRFYVCFSSPMQRGRAGAEIMLLGPDGEPEPDALYRAPVELWDRSMQCLTVLLDPGRLKRGVGPNRELGLPLQAGRVYTLAVGAGMTDVYGDRIPETACKRFRVTDAVREPIAVEQWKIAPPVTDSHQPLVLMFPRPLDWALLSHTIAIGSTGGQSIDGRIAIDQRERRWRLTPTSPWTAGSYHVRVGSSLEDVCGNSIIAAFDRPLRSGGDLAYEVTSRSIPFSVV